MCVADYSYMSDLYFFSELTHSSNNQGRKTESLQFEMQNDAELMALLPSCSRTQRAQRHHDSLGIPFHLFQMWKRCYPVRIATS